MISIELAAIVPTAFRRRLCIPLNRFAHGLVAVAEASSLPPAEMEEQGPNEFQVNFTIECKHQRDQDVPPMSALRTRLFYIPVRHADPCGEFVTKVLR